MIDQRSITIALNKSKAMYGLCSQSDLHTIRHLLRQIRCKRGHVVQRWLLLSSVHPIALIEERRHIHRYLVQYVLIEGEWKELFIGEKISITGCPPEIIATVQNNTPGTVNSVYRGGTEYRYLWMVVMLKGRVRRWVFVYCSSLRLLVEEVFLYHRYCGCRFRRY